MSINNKPKVLILGGNGFIGRHLVEHLITNELVAEVRVVDKTPPQMAWMNQKHTKVFSSPLVEFCSANLINPSSCANAFAAPASGASWDFVFNCAAETRPRQSGAVYAEGVTKLSLNCAEQCAITLPNVKRFVELSSGNMLSTEHKPLQEDSTATLQPWTHVASAKRKVEQTLQQNHSNLPWTILRLPIVYGKSDRQGLTPRIVIAAIYKYLNLPMKLLWNESLRLNTVHVHDVVASMWYLANCPAAERQIYNVVDDAQSTQGSLSAMLSDIFAIKVDYWGTVVSSITKVNMNEVVEEINDKHLGPWAELCRHDKIENTPLTPYMDEELLYNKHLNLDNSKLKTSGYKLQHPHVTRDLIQEIITDYIAEGLMPCSLNY